MSRPKRRHKTGFSYIGAGNNKSVFNRKANRIFSKTKNQLNNSSIKAHQFAFKNSKLTKVERAKIKNSICTKNKKNILTLLLSILIPIIFTVIALIEDVLSKYK